MKISSVLIVGVACCCAVPGFSGCGPSGYTARAVLRIAPPEPSTVAQPALVKEYSDIYRNTQKELVQSRLVLMAALRRPEVTNLPSIQQAKERDPVRWLRDHVKVDFPGNAEIMLISCTCSDPKEAAVLARTVVEAYMGEVVEKEKSQKVARYFDLVKICDAKESEIRSKRQELVNLVGPNGGVAGGEVLSIKQKLMLEELSYLTHGFAKTQFEMNKLQADLAGQKAMLKSAEKSADGKSSHAIEMEVVKLEAVLLTMQQQQSVSQAAIAKMRGAAETFGNAGLDVEMLRAEVKRLESALAIFSAERERLDAEKRAPSRVTVLENAEVPLSKD